MWMIGRDLGATLGSQIDQQHPRCSSHGNLLLSGIVSKFVLFDQFPFTFLTYDFHLLSFAVEPELSPKESVIGSIGSCA